MPEDISPALIDEIIDGMSVDFPEHQPGTRPIHTKGIAVAGQFRATRDAQEYCVARQFDGSWTPAVVRFSNGNGQPDPDGRLQPRGMAVKLYAGGTREPDPDVEHQDQATAAGLRVEEQPVVPAVRGGQVDETDLICMSVPVFMAQSAEGVLEFEKAYRPRKVRPPSLLTRLASLARMSPLPPLEAGVSMSGNEGFLEWARGYEPAQGFLLDLSLERLPASYARIVYHAVHAFEVEGADGTRRMVRFSFEPSDGVRNEGPPEAIQSPIASFLKPHPVNEYGQTLPPDYLQAELRQRISYAPSRFNLRMQVADPWDDTSDPTKAWPINRPRVLMGTLFLSHVLTDQIAGCEELTFNPGRLLRGMGPSDDPVLRQRVAVYEESYRRRMKDRGQGCPVS
jgi:catalase